MYDELNCLHLKAKEQKDDKERREREREKKTSQAIVLKKFRKGTIGPLSERRKKQRSKWKGLPKVT